MQLMVRITFGRNAFSVQAEEVQNSHKKLIYLFKNDNLTMIVHFYHTSKCGVSILNLFFKYLICNKCKVLQKTKILNKILQLFVAISNNRNHEEFPNWTNSSGSIRTETVYVNTFQLMSHSRGLQGPGSQFKILH